MFEYGGSSTKTSSGDERRIVIKSNAIIFHTKLMCSNSTISARTDTHVGILDMYTRASAPRKE